MKKLLISALLISKILTAMQPQSPLPKTPLRPLGGVAVVGPSAPGLTPAILEDFNKKVQMLAESKTPEVMAIHKELSDLAQRAATKKIFLSDLITNLEAINNKLSKDPLKKIPFTSKLDGNPINLTLGNFADVFLRPIITNIRKFISIFGITPDVIARFTEVTNALPVDDKAHPQVVEARLELSDILDAVQQKTISATDLLNRLYALASKLEDKPQYADVTFTMTPYGELSLAQFSRLLLRHLIETVEKKLERPTPALAKQAPRTPATTPAGLSNIGNSCFMNASLQNLYALDQLTDRLLDRKASGLYPEHTYGGEYLNFLQLMRESTKTVLVPRALCYRGWAKLGFAPLTQQDNDEFITSLLSELIVLERNDPLAQLLAIQLQAYIGLEPSAPTTLLVLSIAPTKNTLDLCLKDFFSPEKVELGGKIEEKVEKIVSTGQYLILHLKRNVFEQDPKTKQFGLRKIDTPISFPISNLNLNAYAVPGVQLPAYKLKGITIHAGSARGGHYTGYVRYGNQWYFVNDSEVKQVAQQEIERIAKQGFGSDKTQLPTTFFYERM